MNRIHEEYRFDTAIPFQAAGALVSPFFPMKDTLRALFVAECGTLAAGETLTLDILQARSATGAGAKGIPFDPPGQRAAATVTANQKIAVGTVDTTAAAPGDTLTIISYREGYFPDARTYTVAAATDADAGKFADAAGLVLCVNHPTKGVPGLTAAAVGAVVTITASDAVFTMTQSAGGGSVLATVAAVIGVEIENLDLDPGFGFVAARIATTAAAGTVGVKLIRQMRDGVKADNAYAAFGMVAYD